jgi:hypothetical protein
MRDFVPLVLQISAQNVAKDESAKIADMREIPNRRPADIHPHAGIVQRLKVLDLTG